MFETGGSSLEFEILFHERITRKNDPVGRSNNYKTCKFINNCSISCFPYCPSVVAGKNIGVTSTTLPAGLPSPTVVLHTRYHAGSYGL